MSALVATTVDVLGGVDFAGANEVLAQGRRVRADARGGRPDGAATAGRYVGRVR